MEFIDPLSNPEAYKYAFVSGIREHLRILKDQTRLRDLLNDENGDEMDQDNEKTKMSIETRDLIYHLDSVIDFVFGDILKYHVKKDIEQSKNWGLPSKALTHGFANILLGTDINEITIPPNLHTSNLIDATNEIHHGKHFMVSREEELGKEFYAILRNAFAFHYKFVWNRDGQTTKESAVMLSSFVAAFLRDSVKEYPQVFSRRAYLIDRAQHVIEELEFYSKIKTDNVPLHELYEGFEQILKSHLELLLSKSNSVANSSKVVLKLREQGNNLMANYAYAQAIKVYTEAVLICSGDSMRNLPQILVNRAIAFIGLTCFPEAITDLNLALKYDITSIPAWVQLAYAQLYMGNSLLSLKCYSVALKCCTGKVVPYVFPSDETQLEEYRNNKIKSTLPQLVEQILRSVQLTETRAKQQRLNATEINQTINDIKESAKILSEHVDEDDMSSYLYPPQNCSPSTFRGLANQVQRSRPGMYTHSASQAVGIAEGSTSLSSGASTAQPPAATPIISLDTSVRPFRTERRENGEAPMVDPLGGLLSGGRSTTTRAAGNDIPGMRNGFNGANEPHRVEGPDRLVRDFVRDFLPGVSDGINNILGHSTGVTGTDSPREGHQRGNSQTNGNTQSRSQSQDPDDIPESNDLD